MANSSPLVLPRTMAASVLLEALDGCGVVGRLVVFEHARGAGGAQAVRGEDVLDGERQSGERRQMLPRCQAGVDAVGLFGAFGRDRQEGVQLEDYAFRCGREIR